MKKVGLVTYCEGNFGSVLQCYATQSLLRERGVTCELLRRREATRGGALRMKLSYRVDRTRKYLRYKSHRAEFDRMVALLSDGSAPRMNEASAQRTRAFIDTHIVTRDVSYGTVKRVAKTDEYAAFLSGSDQIWSATWFIRNPWWFLRFAPASKRVAFCPSFGGAAVAEYNLRDYRRYIGEYAYLSAREASGAQIIRDLTGREAEVLSDPVVLLDRQGWSDFCKDGLRPDEPYILLFFLDKPSELALSMLRRVQALTGRRAVVFAYEHEELADLPVYSGDPADFVSVIRGADFVLTDSFHACMFSTILGVPFFIFNRNSSASVQSERVCNHVTTYGLADRYLHTEREVSAVDLVMAQDALDTALADKRAQMRAYMNTVMTGYGL